MLRSVLLLVVASACVPATAVDLVIDYTYDTNNFFGAGNPAGAAAGAQARESLEAAADYFSAILDDNFSAIQTPADFSSSVGTGVATWSWTSVFSHPGTGGNLTLTNQSIAEDEYLIYAGGRPIAGTTLGIGGPGGFGLSADNNGGGFTPSEGNQLDSITSSFFDSVRTRGQGEGDFGRWGGAITFDSSGTVWNYDVNSDPSPGQNDFFSVAIHELGHAIGIGASDEWNDRVVNSAFRGSNALAANGGMFPAAVPGHWAPNTQSTVYGTPTPQEASMTPAITTGTRKLWTTLDAAGLADIGWIVIDPPVDPALPGDYNDDGFVDAADYTVWRDALGTPNPVGSYAEWSSNYGATANGFAVPEPAAALLVLIGMMTLSRRR